MLLRRLFSIVLIIFETYGKVDFVPGYRIKEGMIPTYLYYTFTNLPEEVFPADITIEMSLSRMPGTLLYSVDSNNNQMIVSITDGHTPSLDIEFSKEHVYVSLSKLCNLEYPRYIKLKLRIQMRELMYIQCNDGLMESAKYQRTGILNKDYPIPKFVNKTDKLQAYLWLVNTPPGYGVHVNSDQLSGCIFKVLYKKQQLTMGTHQTEDRCPITCTNNVCNTGQCLETYNALPICNCTSSFYNGPNCNESLHKGHYLTKQQFQFKAIKLVWIKSDKILELNNTVVRLELSTKNITSLIFTIVIENKFLMKIESTITNNYQRRDIHLLIFIFNESSVNLKYKSSNSSWTDIHIPTDHDISRVLFNVLKLNGTDVDLSYKNDIKELRWSKILYDKPETTVSPINNYTSTTRNSTVKRQINIIARAKKMKSSLFLSDLKLAKLQSRVSWILALLILIVNVLILYGVVKIFCSRKRTSKEYFRNICIKIFINNKDTSTKEELESNPFMYVPASEKFDSSEKRIPITDEPTSEETDSPEKRILITPVSSSQILESNHPRIYPQLIDTSPKEELELNPFIPDQVEFHND